MTRQSANRKPFFAILTITFLLASTFFAVPLVTADTHWDATVELDNHTASQTSTYNLTYTSGNYAVIPYIELHFPAGFNASAAELSAVVNLGGGELWSFDEQTIVYQIANPGLIPIGRTIALQVSGIVNVAASGHYNITTRIVDNSYNTIEEVQSNNFTINPLLTINPHSGGAKTNVNISGLYFGANELVCLTFNDTTIETLTTNSTGGFSTTYTVTTDGSISDECYFNATDADGFYAPALFGIYPLAISVEPHRGHAGETATVTGYGFSPNCVVAIDWDMGRPTQFEIAEITTDSDGAFTDVNFTVPDNRAGTHYVTGTDTDGHTDTASYRIDPPSIALEYDIGARGFNFTVTGYYFTPNSTVTLLWDNFSANTTLGSATVLANGTFFATCTVPTTARTDYNFVYAVASDLKSADTEYEVLDTILRLNVLHGIVGSNINAIGGGYTANSIVTLTWNGTTTATATSDNLGNFNINITVPIASGGRYQINATDTANITKSRLFLVDPNLTVSAVNGSAGKAITVVGTGWAASRNASLHLSPDWLGVIVANFVTDASGGFNVTFIVPAIDHLKYYVDVSYNGVVFEDYAFTRFTVLPGLILSPSSGLATTVVGTSFEPDTEVTILSNGAPLLTAHVDSNGNFTTILSFANTAATYNITAVDTQNNTASATFTVPNSAGSSGATGQTGGTGSTGSTTTGPKGDEGEKGDTGETGPTASPRPSSSSNDSGDQTMSTYVPLGLCIAALVLAIIAVLAIIIRRK